MRAGITPATTPPPSVFARALRFLPAAVWMGVIFLVSAQETVPTPPGFNPSLTSILGHFTVYAILAALLWHALGAFALTPWRRIAIAFAGAALYGISDEWHQAYVPGRYPDAFDVLVDAIGAAAGIAALTWASHRWQRGA